MLLDKYLNDLQKFTDEKITYENVAKVLKLSGKQSVGMRISRKQELKEWEIEALDNAFKNKNKSSKSTQDDYAEIPIKNNVFASMGYGIQVFDETQTGTYSISKKLAKDIGVDLNNSTMIFAKGDSMLPTIVGGDSLLVDMSKREVYDGSIYCVRIEKQLYAKRLQKIPPSIIAVISDNPKYKTFEINLKDKIDYDFEIIGEVRWWGRVAK